MNLGFTTNAGLRQQLAQQQYQPQYQQQMPDQQQLLQQLQTQQQAHGPAPASIGGYSMFGDYNLGDMGVSQVPTSNFQGSNTQANNLQSLYRAMQRENNQMPYLPAGMNQQMARSYFLPQPAQIPQQNQQPPPSQFQPLPGYHGNISNGVPSHPRFGDDRPMQSPDLDSRRNLGFWAMY